MVAFDDDPAGHQASGRLLRLLLGRDVAASVALLPPAQDPASLLHQHGPARLDHSAPHQTRPLADSVIQARLNQSGDRLAWVEGQVGAVRSVAPLVASLPPDDVNLRSKRLAASTGPDAKPVHGVMRRPAEDSLITLITLREERDARHHHRAGPARSGNAAVHHLDDRAAPRNFGSRGCEDWGIARVVRARDMWSPNSALASDWPARQPFSSCEGSGRRGQPWYSRM